MSGSDALRGGLYRPWATGQAALRWVFFCAHNMQSDGSIDQVLRLCGRWLGMSAERTFSPPQSLPLPTADNS